MQEATQKGHAGRKPCGCREKRGRIVSDLAEHRGLLEGGVLHPREKLRFSRDVYISHPLQDKRGDMWDVIEVHVDGLYKDGELIQEGRGSLVPFLFRVKDPEELEGHQPEGKPEVMKVRVEYVVANNRNTDICFNEARAKCLRLGYNTTLKDHGYECGCLQKALSGEFRSYGIFQ